LSHQLQMVLHGLASRRRRENPSSQQRVSSSRRWPRRKGLRPAARVVARRWTCRHTCRLRQDLRWCCIRSDGACFSAYCCMSGRLACMYSSSRPHLICAAVQKVVHALPYLS
jgi:hypothetical protein